MSHCRKHDELWLALRELDVIDDRNCTWPDDPRDEAVAEPHFDGRLLYFAVAVAMMGFAFVGGAASGWTYVSARRKARAR